MLFYISIFCSICLLLLIEEKLPDAQKKYARVFMLLILGSVTAFRAIGGSDFDIYTQAYESVPTFGKFISDVDEVQYDMRFFGMELGYLLYISFIKTFSGLSFYGYLVLQSVLIYTLMYIGLRRYTYHWGIIMIVFLYKMFFYETFVSMRQPLTIVLFYCILYLIYERKPWKYYLLLVFILMPLHNGSIFLLIVYPIMLLKITKRRIILLNCIFIPTWVISGMGVDILGSVSSIIDPLLGMAAQDKVDGYLANEEGLGILHTLEYFVMMSLVIFNYDRIVSTHKYGAFIIKLFLILLPIMTLFSSSLIFRREVDYFIPTYAILLGYLCDIHKRYKSMIIFGLIVVCFYGYIRFLTRFDLGGLMPYKSWLEIPYTSFFIE